MGKAYEATVQKDFREKYRELKIESNRGNQADTYYMGKQSLSRQRYHEQRTRRDSQGTDYYQERKGRSDSRGRPFFRRYYRKETVRPRNRSEGGRQRDRSSIERGKTDERRSGSRDNRK